MNDGGRYRGYFPNDETAESIDSDGDGVGDNTDEDDDNDGVVDGGYFPK